MTAAPVGDSLIASFARTQPDFAVRAAGHSTCWNVTGVIGVLEPVESPVTALFEGRREGVAVGSGGYTTVLSSPACGGSSVFWGTAIEDSKTTAWHLNTKYQLKS